MALTLRIENETRLPDGGPLVFRLSGRRGADIGRDPYLDWTLPDPSRFISGKHCEIRWTDGGYVLSDVSTNGTFLNGSDRRMDGPHRLIHGDRILIGNYIIVAEFDDDVGYRPPVQDIRGSETADFWSAEGAAAPVDRSSLVQRHDRPVQADFLDWAAELPPVDTASSRGRGAEAFEPPGWQHGSSAPNDPFASPRTPGTPANAAPPVWGETPPPPMPSPVRPNRPPPPPGTFDAPPADLAPPPFPSVPSFPGEAAAPSAVWVDSKPSGDWASTPDATAESAAPPPAPAPAFEAPVFEPPAFDARAAEPPRPTPPAAAPSAPIAPPPVAPVASAPAVASTTGGSAAGRLGALAQVAGVPAEVFARRDGDEVMRDVGAMLHITARHMMALLAARTETKRAFRSAEHTMIGATDNNPLKFSPNPEEALRLMLGPPLRSYLDGKAALEEGFTDLANHQLRTFAAMQQALKMLIEDLDPAEIDKAAEPEGGIGALIGSRKGRLWEQYVIRWQAKTMRNEDGMVGLFLMYFAECYDRLGAQTRKK